MALVACNDDDSIIDRTGGNNLQIEVSANFHSRAPIHGSTLPDNNPIGVTLTAKDGSSYDNQNYNNIPYSATTSDGKQTWMPQDKPVTLSVTEGVAMAYWPYNADAADMTAVPVETDTQTDYMYSGNVTGLTNATPKAAFQMKHAMTLIRVNVVRGTYTAAGAVTAVSAASEAFCTSGTMNVSTGALAGLAGAGTPFLEEPADAAITTAGRVTEFLVLPDVTVDAASVALGVTVDGRKYNTAIEVSEAFKQGYIYTYNLTLDNTALNVSAVAVTPWEVEISVEAPEPVAEDDQYIVQVTIDSDNYTYTHNIGGLVGTIDWGDGTTTAYDSKTSYPSHTYATAGKYLVVCSGKASNIKSYDWRSIQNYGGTPTRDISKLIHIGGEMGIMSMEMCFQNQTKLTEIPAGIFDGLTEVTNFWWGFGGCTNITGGIPEGLFDKCTKVGSFNRMFENCKGLTGPIPAGLFDNCPEVTDFAMTFAGCSGITAIPAGLFDYNSKVTTFSSTFFGCSGIMGIPEGLFDKCTEATNFSQTFRDCSGLMASIPEELFDKCTEVTNFSAVFWGCSGLTGSIPVGLFDNNTKVTTFQSIFLGCKGLTGPIPEGLFDNCTEVTDFSGAFNGCTGLTSIPEGLFYNNAKVKTFQTTFQGCSGLTSIPEGLFDNNINVISFLATFHGCSNLKTIPIGLFDKNIKTTTFNETFSGCKGLTAIPEKLFDNCPNVTDLGGVFIYTSIIDIPVNLFNNNTKVTNFGRLFQGCASLINIPEGLFDKCTEVTNFAGAFQGCTGITSIPEGLFDYNTKVTSFNRTFRECVKLNDISIKIFDKCTEVIDFFETFYGCTALTGESPYTTIKVDGSDVKVHLYERSLYPEYFTAPTNYTRCFSGCKNLIDWAEITAGGWN